MVKYISGFVIGIAFAAAVAGSLVHWGPFFVTTDEFVEAVDAQTISLMSNLFMCDQAYRALVKKGNI